MSNFKVDERLVDLLPAEMTKEGREQSMRIFRGIEGIRSNVEKVGYALQEMAEADRVLFLKACPVTLHDLLKRCLRVAEGELDAKLALASGRAAQKLMKLPIDEQHQFLIEKIPVALPNGDKKFFDVEEMPAEVVPQVFAEGGKSARVRSIAEQKQWVRKKEQAQEKKVESDLRIDRPNKWAVRNGKAFIAKRKFDAGLTLEDIEAIRKDLKS